MKFSFSRVMIGILRKKQGRTWGWFERMKSFIKRRIKSIAKEVKMIPGLTDKLKILEERLYNLRGYL